MPIANMPDTESLDAELERILLAGSE